MSKDFEYEEKIAELLEIPLKCPHCKEVLKEYKTEEKPINPPVKRYWMK